MEEKRTVTIDLDRYDELLRDSCDLRAVETDIENIRAMVFGEIAKDCRKYGEVYADGECTAIMCRRLFHKIGINDPSCNPLVREAIEEYKAKTKKTEEEA
jgi:hypothetical protein